MPSPRLLASIRHGARRFAHWTAIALEGSPDDLALGVRREALRRAGGRAGRGRSRARERQRRVVYVPRRILRSDRRQAGRRRAGPRGLGPGRARSRDAAGDRRHYSTPRCANIKCGRSSSGRATTAGTSRSRRDFPAPRSRRRSDSLPRCRSSPTPRSDRWAPLRCRCVRENGTAA